jgi:hypothetical protein
MHSRKIAFIAMLLNIVLTPCFSPLQNGGPALRRRFRLSSIPILVGQFYKRYGSFVSPNCAIGYQVRIASIAGYRGVHHDPLAGVLCRPFDLWLPH